MRTGRWVVSNMFTTFVPFFLVALAKDLADGSSSEQVPKHKATFDQPGRDERESRKQTLINTMMPLIESHGRDIGLPWQNGITDNHRHGDYREGVGSWASYSNNSSNKPWRRRRTLPYHRCGTVKPSLGSRRHRRPERRGKRRFPIFCPSRPA
jgi:hypothetical protein